MSDAITRATEILKPTDEQFIIIAEGENKEIEVRHRFNYTQGMVMFAAMAKSLMDAFQRIGYPVHSDLRNILECAIKMYGKQSSRDNVIAKKLMEMAGYRDIKEQKNYNKDKIEQFSQSISENDTGNDVENMIHALRCCAEINCAECPRFFDEDEDGENKYTTLCNQALMTEAALMLEEYANGTRRREDDPVY